jgi:glycosyltransferase involved in cell wall biosynthesis
MKPLVSILIPAYNAELYIAETLASSLAQTWENIEIIVVDDGSTDHTLVIAKSYESKCVKVISQPNQGASATRNRALRESQGDFIQYLDADDLIAPDKIGKQLKSLEFDRNSEYIASGEWARFFKCPNEANFVQQDLWRDLVPVDWLMTAWTQNLMMHPAAWLLPRGISDLVGYWNENISLNDDGEYFCRAILASKQVKFCNGAKSYYRSGISGSLSGLKSRKAWESAFLTVEICTNTLLDEENSDRTRLASACYWQYFIFMVYPQAPDLIKYATKKVVDLGGGDLKPEGGTLFKMVRDIFGWKIAIHLQRIYYKYRYQSR